MTNSLSSSTNVSPGSERSAEKAGSSNISFQDVSLSSSFPMCRICHCDGEEESLVKPCRCSGSVRFAHQSCLRTWIVGSGLSCCELCNYQFRTKKKRVKSVRQLRFLRPSLKGWLHVSLFLAFFGIMVTSTTWIMWSQISNSKQAKTERNDKDVYYAYALNGAFVIIACLGLYLDSLAQWRAYYRTWCLINKCLVILPYDSLHDDIKPLTTPAQSVAGQRDEIALNLHPGMVQPTPTNYHCVQCNPEPEIAQRQWSTMTSYVELQRHNAGQQQDESRQSRSAPPDIQYCSVLREPCI